MTAWVSGPRIDSTVFRSLLPAMLVNSAGTERMARFPIRRMEIGKVWGVQVKPSIA